MKDLVKYVTVSDGRKLKFMNIAFLAMIVLGYGWIVQLGGIPHVIC